jgi:hypothetical protein
MPVTCRRRSSGTGTTRPASRSRRNNGPALATTSRGHRRGPTTATTLVVPPSWLSRCSTARTPGNVARHTTTTVGRLAASPARCSGAGEPRSTTVATSVPAGSGQSTGGLSLARRYKLISVRIPRRQPPVGSVPSSTDAAAASPDRLDGVDSINRLDRFACASACAIASATQDAPAPLCAATTATHSRSRGQVPRAV